MTHRSREGKAAWVNRSGRYHEELTEQIRTGAAGQLLRWGRRGRIPGRVRLYARLRGQRLHLPGTEEQT
jgi:hypothetical protein